MSDLEAPIVLSLEPDTELADRDPQPFSVESIRDSKIVATLTHAQYDRYEKKTACMLALEFAFIPAYQIRFKFAEIELKVVRGGSSSIIAYQPHRWEGKPSSLPVQRSSNINARIGGAGGGAEAGLDAGYGVQTERSEVKRATLQSTLEGSAVTWRLGENDVTREGIPQPLKVALIVETEGTFSLRISYRVQLSTTADPRTWRAAYARLANPLDLSRGAVGGGKGPGITGLDSMEDDSFALCHLAETKWDL